MAEVAGAGRAGVERVFRPPLVGVPAVVEAEDVAEVVFGMLGSAAGIRAVGFEGDFNLSMSESQARFRDCWAIEGILRTKLAGILTSDCPSEVFQQSPSVGRPTACTL